MPRTNLKKAREAKDLSQADFAKLVEVRTKTVSEWETGARTPYAYSRRRVRKVLDNQDENLFALDSELESSVEEPDEKQDLQPCQIAPTRDILDSSDSHIDVQESVEELFDMDKGRRNLNNTIAAGIIAASTPVALVSSVQVITGPVIEPEEYLALCDASIGTWWHWYNTGNYLELESTLNKNVPVLKRIATSFSPFQTTISPIQKEAASFAVQAKIMQIGLSNRNLEYSQREKHCYDAVEMASLSDDKNLLALAQFWYGDTFTYCYNQPQTALQHLNDALKNVSNVDGNPLIAIQIYSDLSIAHAQNHDEKKALDCIELVYSTMPSNPALDNRLYKIGHAELDQKVGKTYLSLAEYLPDGYAQKAYEMFNKSTSKQATSTGYLVQALIRKADALRALGDMRECVKNLTKGYKLSSSVERLNQIDDVLRRVPDKWKTETSIQELQKDISHALEVARG